MRRYKAILLSATASAALLGIVSAASAFEEVDWTWDATVTEDIRINVDINTEVDPTGLVQVEKLQMHFGDLNATSTIDGVENNPAASTNGGAVDIDDTFVFTGNSEDDTDPSEMPETIGVGGTSGLVATLVPPSTFDEGSDDFSFTVTLEGQITVPPGDDEIYDAVDLPKVLGSATAVANNQSIDADVPIYLHDAQFAAGEFNPICEDSGGACTAIATIIGAAGLFEVDGQLEDLNEHTTIAGLMTIAAATGLVNPASINATASVANVLNAYVENSATAVTNNASFTIESDKPDNHVLVADLTQWGYANVTASASVNGVSLANYTGFGDAGLGGGLDDITPVVSNTATAVGNNLSISVGNISTD